MLWLRVACCGERTYFLSMLSFKFNLNVSPLLRGSQAIHLLYVVDNKLCYVSKHPVFEGDSRTSGLERAGY